MGALAQFVRNYSASLKELHNSIQLAGKTFLRDEMTNVTPKILSHIGQDLHNKQSHPLELLKKRVINYFYEKYKGRTGNPLFCVYDRFSPVVSTQQNFDSLLIPKDHPSRSKSDCYYINREFMLRAHTSAHQSELIKSGLDNFLIIGDVYRRDQIDSTHYPVFHQADAVRLFTTYQLENINGGNSVTVFEKGSEETPEKQKEHTRDASIIVGQELKNTLISLAKVLFGNDVKCRWVDVYFPFTHPSWELEVELDGNWVEVLGCGVIRQSILTNAGAADRIGWAFGLGLERLAMRMYSITDIRQFWSEDSGFLSQFEGKSFNDSITLKRVSVYPQLINDLSFWLPSNDPKAFHPNDFYELARSVGGPVVEQVKLIDEFTHPKTQKRSLCFRIIYRHLERTLTQKEVSKIHDNIAQTCTKDFGVTIR